jgi:hypothetical protein
MSKVYLLEFLRQDAFKINSLKWSKFLIITTVCLIFSMNSIFSQTARIWDYPVRYGTEEWKKLKSFKDQLNAYNIPDSLLKIMETKDLVATCILYPDHQ